MTAAECDGSEVVIRFTPLAADRLLENAEDTFVDESDRGRQPPRYGVSVIAGWCEEGEDFAQTSRVAGRWANAEPRIQEEYSMNRVRVEIDLNSLRSDGTTRVRLARVSGHIEPGQIVTAFESEDNVAGYALVDRVDRARGYAFLTVNRQSMRDDDGVLDEDNLYNGTNRAVAHVANARAQRATEGATSAHSVHRRAFQS